MTSPVFFTADELSELEDESEEALRPAFLCAALGASLVAEDRLGDVLVFCFSAGAGVSASSASSSLSSSLDSAYTKGLCV